MHKHELKFLSLIVHTIDFADYVESHLYWEQVTEVFG